MKKWINMKTPIAFILIAVFFPLISAIEYGDGIYGENIYGGNFTLPGEYCGDGRCNHGEDCGSCTIDCGGCPGEEKTGGSSGGGSSGNKTFGCSLDTDCKPNQYCFNSKCFDSECSDNSFCEENEGEVCWNHRCVKLFDMEILEFESPVKLGEFFNFTYFIKAVAEIKGDVEIDFWIEKDGNKIASGKDTIYMSGFEEKTKFKKLFLPSDVASGSYMFYIQVTYETYTAKAYRNIEIRVDKEGEAAKIKFLPEINSFVGYIVVGMIGLGVFLLCLVFYLERRKIKRWYLYEQKWIKKHRVFIIVLVILIILGFLGYYFKWYEEIARLIIEIDGNNLGVWLVAGGAVIILTILCIYLHKMRKKKPKYSRHQKEGRHIEKRIIYSS
jgi:hypothetical protein